MDTRSYIQSPASFLTPETIRLGVSVGPDKNDRRSLCPVARILTELPPTSTASTALTEDFIATSFCRTVPFSTASSDLARIALARSRENGAFGSNHAHQVVPRIDERLGAFVLKLGRQRMDVDPGPGESRQHLFAVAAVRWHGRLDNAVFGKHFQRALRHGVHGEWRGQGLDVKDVRSLRILGPGAGPQKALRTRAGIIGAYAWWRP